MSWWDRTAALKAVLSLFIAYHLLVILLIPNYTFFITEVLGKWIHPYANELGLNANWSFFAPNPMAPAIVTYEPEPPTRPPSRGLLPDPRCCDFRQMKDRRLAFLALSFQFPSVRGVLVDWMCRATPGAARLRVSRFTVPAPTLEEVLGGASLNDLSRIKLLENEVLTCAGNAAGR